jgi:hypothetical protein
VRHERGEENADYKVEKITFRVIFGPITLLRTILGDTLYRNRSLMGMSQEQLLCDTEKNGRMDTMSCTNGGLVPL